MRLRRSGPRLTWHAARFQRLCTARAGRFQTIVATASAALLAWRTSLAGRGGLVLFLLVPCLTLLPRTFLADFCFVSAPCFCCCGAGGLNIGNKMSSESASVSAEEDGTRSDASCVPSTSGDDSDAGPIHRKKVNKSGRRLGRARMQRRLWNEEALEQLARIHAEHGAWAGLVAGGRSDCGLARLGLDCWSGPLHPTT